jgi:modification methylase
VEKVADPNWCNDSARHSGHFPCLRFGFQLCIAVVQIRCLNRTQMDRTLKSRKASMSQGVVMRYPPDVGRPGAFKEAFDAAAKALADLPESDNTEGAVERMLRANAILRHLPWPKPFDETTHELRRGDARDLSWLGSESVHLVVTSPPYWTLKEYEPNASQMGAIHDYETFLTELDKAWQECSRILVPGGRICCVVGDVCVPRKREGRHYVLPLHADIQTRARKLGLDCLTPIFWQKIANGATEVEGNGAGFYGKPYQPGAIIKNDVEYILFLRKGGQYRSPSTVQRALSMLTREEMQSWTRSSWTDIKGESTRKGHPAPFPVELAERLIRMFSFAGDMILDPFAGTGSTALAALSSGRSSISVDIEPKYLGIAKKRLLDAHSAFRYSGAVKAKLSLG